MDTTRASLLIRIRDLDDVESWREFHELYSPLLYRYARARGLNHDEAEEIRSSCLETLVTHIREFDYSAGKGGFKAWLRRMVLNRVIDLKRKLTPKQLDSQEMEQNQAPEMTPDEIFDEQWKLSHLKYCLGIVQTLIPEKTYQAFEMLANDVSVTDVCDQLEMNSNQVYKAKSKVMKLVRDRMRTVYGEEIS